MKTVYVIGAGASVEFGFPVGEGLKKRIIALMATDRDFIKGYSFVDHELQCALKQTARSFSEYSTAVKKIKSVLPLAGSIDEFIDDQRDENISFIGKLAIVRSILEYERNSPLLTAGRTDEELGRYVTRNADSWIGKFARNVFSNRESLEEKLSSNTIICFNYDRCIEQFLFNALKAYHSLSDTDANEYLQHLTIIHPYGQVGYLPWQEGEPKASFGHNFKENHECFNLVDISSNIQTFTESIASEMNAKIKVNIREADRLVFIGFGFNTQNIEILSDRSSKPEIFGTSFNLKMPAIASVKKDLMKSFFSDMDAITNPIQIQLDDPSVKAADVFEHYRL